MICIIRLTFWSLPLIWLAIAVLAVAVAYLYYKVCRVRHTFYTPKEVAAMLDLQEYIHKTEGRHPSLNAIIDEIEESEKGGNK